MESSVECGPPEDGRYVLHFRPDAARFGALENRLDDAIRAVAVLEGRNHRREPPVGWPGGDRRVDLAHHIAEGIRPPFLMPSWQVRVPSNRRIEQRWILLQHLIGVVPTPDPQLVLML